MLVLPILIWALCWVAAAVITVSILLVVAPFWLLFTIVRLVLERKLRRMYEENPGLEERVEYWNQHPQAYRLYKRELRQAKGGKHRYGKTTAV